MYLNLSYEFALEDFQGKFLEKVLKKFFNKPPEGIWKSLHW